MEVVHIVARWVLLAIVTALFACVSLAEQGSAGADAAGRHAAQAWLEMQRSERQRALEAMRRAQAHARMGLSSLSEEQAWSAANHSAAVQSCPVPVATGSPGIAAHPQSVAGVPRATLINGRSSGRLLPSRSTKAQKAQRAAAAQRPSKAHQAAQAAPVAVTAQQVSHSIPLFVAASDTQRQGFVRIVNHTAQAGVVEVEAIDDRGERFGPVQLAVAAGAVVHFNAQELEQGNAHKGLAPVGDGNGDWRLLLTSSLDFEALSYLRTHDGFLAAMHDLVPEQEGTHRVVTFNPGSNVEQASRLRLINPGEQAATVTVRGTDDLGQGGESVVEVSVPAMASRTLTAQQLESGHGAGILSGQLGDGDGKWRLEVTADAPVRVMSLLASASGHLANLSSAPSAPSTPTQTDATVHRVPLFPSASHPERQGFIRVVNHSTTDGVVEIQAFDASQHDYRPITLAIGAGQAMHFNSNDLEFGNAAKGIAGVGSGEGSWRLHLRSTLAIEVLAYVRTRDGFLTTVHDQAPSVGNRHRIPFLNPASNTSQPSWLRLVNMGEQAEVAITGIDDQGVATSDAVRLTLPAHGARTLSAGQLESGEGLTGALGDGTGKWRLVVEADQAIAAMALLESANGHLSNLSTTPRGARLGGVETLDDAFRTLVSASIVQTRCIRCHVRDGAAAGTRLIFAGGDASHVAQNLAVFTDFLRQEGDGAELILNKIQGVDHGGGVQIAAGSTDYANMAYFLGRLGAAVESPTLAPDNLFDGVQFASARQTLRRAALIFAGRIPTDEEYAAVRIGSERSLRNAIRALMEGPAFHDFLLRGANDRLLTDRELRRSTIQNDGLLVEYDNKQYELRKAAGGFRRSVLDWDWPVQFGAGRAALELIAHVVENNLPYTEILTADYIMANPYAAQAYGANTVFDDPSDPFEFRPSHIERYFRKGGGHRLEYHPLYGVRVANVGALATDHPHAGVLNTKVFLQRYPTTPTNRNRARSRWAYYHFLGLDVEKSAPRTTDPVALADTDNPTLKNPACTVCHATLDPLAGAFQNYGNAGFYRDQTGGMDALDRFYKYDPPNGQNAAVEARSWQLRREVSVVGTLAAGENTIGLKVANPPGDDTWSTLGLDFLTIRLESGEELSRYQLEELSGGDCGHPLASTAGAGRSYKIWNCMLRVPVEVPQAGTYRVGVAAWILDQGSQGPAEAQLRIWPSGVHYRRGDTWYRDMLPPGLGEDVVPDADASLPWLAQRIAADDRFAAATVKFWWPAVLGSDMAEPPANAQDADFDGRLLAANAQAALAERLATGFQRGFHGGSPFMLKDLLAELALSPWFRADALTDADPLRRDALRYASAGRLLTPEQLAAKTDALMGFEWGRWNHIWARPHRQHTSALRDAGAYRLLYGGIDSEGVVERQRDMTSTMAAVAQSHAVQVSCPVVLREFLLWPEHRRLLFGGIDAMTSPRFVFGASFDIEADSRAYRETVSARATLTAGPKTVRLSFVNDFWDGGEQDRNLRLDRLRVRDAAGRVVVDHELERVALPAGACAEVADDHLLVLCPLTVEVPIDIPTAGAYQLFVVGWADQAGDEAARLQLVVESAAGDTPGERAIRNKLAELHDKLLGVQAAPDGAEVDATYALFVDVWQRRRTEGGIWFRDRACDWGSDIRYFDGLLDNAVRRVENGDSRYLGWNWPEVNRFWREADTLDAHHVARTWVVMLAYLMMDYRYLHL